MARPTGGYVRLHRRILDHWITRDPLAFTMFVTFVAWARRSPGKTLLKRQLVTLQRGQLVTSWNELAKRWDVDRKTIRAKILLLVKDHMLDYKADQRGTIITVLNYDKYQAPLKEHGTTQRTTERTTERTTLWTTERTHREKERKRDLENPPSVEGERPATGEGVLIGRATAAAGRCFAELDAIMTARDEHGVTTTKAMVLARLSAAAGDDWPNVSLAIGHLDSFYTAFNSKRQRRTLNLFRDDLIDRLVGLMSAEVSRETKSAQGMALTIAESNADAR